MKAGANHEGAPTDGSEVASWATSPAVRRNMQANRGKDTEPELAVRQALHTSGLRYRVQYRLPYLRRRSIDIAFTRIKLAIFIDGCFWHHCAQHYVAPKSNSKFWAAKMEGNQIRDMETSELLTAAGWCVLRFWEHEDVTQIVSGITFAIARVGLPLPAEDSLGWLIGQPEAVEADDCPRRPTSELPRQQTE